mgnify:CR=1 FL=1
MTTRRFLCALLPTLVWISSLQAQLIQDVTVTMSDGIRIVTIPRHNPVNAFTMGGIVRDAGLSEEEFRELL